MHSVVLVCFHEKKDYDSSTSENENIILESKRQVIEEVESVGLRTVFVCHNYVS